MGVHQEHISQIGNGLTKLKMTGETPEVRSDKRKPREDRQNFFEALPNNEV